MINYGYIRVGCATPIIKVADIKFNQNSIITLLEEAVQKNINILVFPELCLTGYTCADLFYQDKLLLETEKSIDLLKKQSKKYPLLFSIGAPIRCDNQLFNCSVIICQGKILGIVPKTHLPNYNEFYEKRWFSSALNSLSSIVKLNEDIIPFGTDLLFCHDNVSSLKIAIEICEDLWMPIPPSSFAALSGATIILNSSASNELVGKSLYRKKLIEQQSARSIVGYAYASTGHGESTTDVVYGGHCLIYENGRMLNENERFKVTSSLIYSDIDLELLSQERIKKNNYYNISSNVEYRNIIFSLPFNQKSPKLTIGTHPFVPNDLMKRDIHCQEIFSIQTMGLAKRLEHIGINKVVIGISGGLDSTLALLVCVKTFDKLNFPRKNIIGVTMPGFGTTNRTYQNALNLMHQLNITIKEISIKKACLQHFEDIEHDPLVHNLTYENTQARERTQILMDLAAKEQCIVIGTGDLSELALGWATYNGDHMSMYSVNSSIPKTLVKYLIEWVANYQVNEKSKNILTDIINTPVSPELLPPDKKGKISQKTEEVVGPYELHDFFLYYVLRYGFTPKKIFYLAKLAFLKLYTEEELLIWLKLFYKRFFSQQFKRSCLPDGPKVGSICLSPRGDLRMPSDAISTIWLDELNDINVKE